MILLVMSLLTASLKPHVYSSLRARRVPLPPYPHNLARGSHKTRTAGALRLTRDTAGDPLAHAVPRLLLSPRLVIACNPKPIPISCSRAFPTLVLPLPHKRDHRDPPARPASHRHRAYRRSCAPPALTLPRPRPRGPSAAAGGAPARAPIRTVRLHAAHAPRFVRNLASRGPARRRLEALPQITPLDCFTCMSLR